MTPISDPDPGVEMRICFSSEIWPGQAWPWCYFTEETAALHIGLADGPFQRVGELRFQVADVEGMFNDDMRFSDTFEVNQEMQGLFAQVFDEYHLPKASVLRVASALTEEPPRNAGLLYLDALTIDPRFQGHNLGLLLLREVIQQRRASAGLVLLKAFPRLAQDRAGRKLPPMELRQARRKLYDYFAKLGFGLLGQPIRGAGYMVRSTEYELPPFELLMRHTDDWEARLQAILRAPA